MTIETATAWDDGVNQPTLFTPLNAVLVENSGEITVSIDQPPSNLLRIAIFVDGVRLNPNEDIYYDDLPYAITNLANGQEYAITVALINPNGIVGQQTAPVLGTPTEDFLTATNNRTDGILYAWQTAPGNNVVYRLYLSSPGVLDWTQIYQGTNLEYFLGAGSWQPGAPLFGRVTYQPDGSPESAPSNEAEGLIPESNWVKVLY